jgi:hypothetical protein
MSASSRPVSRRAVGLSVGAVVAALVVVWLVFLRTPAAAPGHQPAAVKPGEAAPPLSPDEGVTVPHLSAAEAAEINKGGSVIRKLPGGGHIKIEPPKKEGNE